MTPKQIRKARMAFVKLCHQPLPWGEVYWRGFCRQGDRLAAIVLAHPVAAAHPDARPRPRRSP
jgi:hypothetical protein